MLTDPNADPALRRGAQHTLVEVLGSLLKLLHPLMPFVTEELWLEIVARRGETSATIMLERFPQAKDFAADAAAEDEIGWLKGFVGGIRQIRGEANLPRSATLNVRLADATAIDRRARRAARESSAQARGPRPHRIRPRRRDGQRRGHRLARRDAHPRAARGPHRRRRRARAPRQATREDAATTSTRCAASSRTRASSRTHRPTSSRRIKRRVAELEQRATQLNQQLARLSELDH